MRKIDINEIQQAVKDGKLSIWVNIYGYIQLRDNETGERVCLGSMEKRGLNTIYCIWYNHYRKSSGGKCLWEDAEQQGIDV